MIGHISRAYEEGRADARDGRKPKTFRGRHAVPGMHRWYLRGFREYRGMVRLEQLELGFDVTRPACPEPGESPALSPIR